MDSVLRIVPGLTLSFGAATVRSLVFLKDPAGKNPDILDGLENEKERHHLFDWSTSRLEIHQGLKIKEQ